MMSPSCDLCCRHSEVRTCLVSPPLGSADPVAALLSVPRNVNWLPTLAIALAPDSVEHP